MYPAQLQGVPFTGTVALGFIMPVTDVDPIAQSLKWFTQGYKAHRWYKLALASSGAPTCVAPDDQQVSLLSASG